MLLLVTAGLITMHTLGHFSPPGTATAASHGAANQASDSFHDSMTTTAAVTAAGSGVSASTIIVTFNALLLRRLTPKHTAPAATHGLRPVDTPRTPIGYAARHISNARVPLGGSGMVRAAKEVHP